MTTWSNEDGGLSLAIACIRIAAVPAARSVFLSLWSAYLASSAFFSLLAESVRAKRARRVESLPFLLKVSMIVGAQANRPTGRCIAFQTYCLLICLCLKEESFWLAGLMMLSEGLTYRGLLRTC